MSSGVEFDEDSFSYGTKPRPGSIPSSGGIGVSSGGIDSESKMVRWLVAHGWAKSPKAAQGLLIGFIILNIIIMFVVIKFFI